ncbi:hypothetical protein TcWFU_000777 [Taenia crassiceps]|uniref:Uncharacterized protein n=1 Tax=Taenia crassiceps TaxID=6207 RepID=A0ABR4QA64_9CEST
MRSCNVWLQGLACTASHWLASQRSPPVDVCCAVCCIGAHRWRCRTHDAEEAEFGVNKMLCRTTGVAFEVMPPPNLAPVERLTCLKGGRQLALRAVKRGELRKRTTGFHCQSVSDLQQSGGASTSWSMESVEAGDEGVRTPVGFRGEELEGASRSPWQWVLTRNLHLHACTVQVTRELRSADDAQRRSLVKRLAQQQQQQVDGDFYCTKLSLARRLPTVILRGSFFSSAQSTLVINNGGVVSTLHKDPAILVFSFSSSASSSSTSCERWEAMAVHDNRVQGVRQEVQSVVLQWWFLSQHCGAPSVQSCEVSIVGRNGDSLDDGMHSTGRMKLHSRMTGVTPS